MGEKRKVKGDEKDMYVHIPTPHREYNYYMLQRCTNESKF